MDSRLTSIRLQHTLLKRSPSLIGEPHTFIKNNLECDSRNAFNFKGKEIVEESD